MEREGGILRRMMKVRNVEKHHLVARMRRSEETKFI